MYKRKVFNDTVASHCNNNNEFGVIQFWSSSEIKTQFPRLSRLALGILSIPASSSPSERAFSVAGNIATKKQNQLSSSSVDALVVLNSYSRFRMYCICDFFMLCSSLIMRTTYGIFRTKLH